MRSQKYVHQSITHHPELKTVSTDPLSLSISAVYLISVTTRGEYKISKCLLHADLKTLSVFMITSQLILLPQILGSHYTTIMYYALPSKARKTDFLL